MEGLHKMKWKMTLLFSVVLAALVISPASALEYTFDRSPSGEFGTPTCGDSVIRAHETPNVDRSKSSAQIPPGFGTPTSYLPYSGEYLTPNLAAGGPLNSSVLTGAAVGAMTGSANGNVVTPPSPDDTSTFTYFVTDSSAPATGFTSVTSDLYYSGGSLGTLNIPAIGLSVKVYEGTDSAALKKGAGHFSDTSIWDGNSCFAAHNRGVNSHFGRIHTLSVGDNITLTTKLGTRTYSVTSVMKIGEMDNSMLAATAENCVTLFTCVRDERDYRWCVRAIAQ